MTKYIGLACTFHDPAVAVLNSRGEIVFAEATERSTQVKRAFNCPPDNLPQILRILDLYCEPDEDLVVARSWSNRALRSVKWGKKIRAFNSLFIREGSKWAASDHFSRSILASMEAAMGLASEGLRHQIYHRSRFSTRQPRVAVRGYDHHLTHAAAGCFTSPFEDSVCAVVDGYGEGSSTAFFHYKEGKLSRIKGRQKSINSLGFYYMALCAACGFDPILGEEWKVMGLAPYGKLDERIYNLLKPALRVEGLRIVSARQQYGNRVWRTQQTCPPEDLAYTGQIIFEECMEELLVNLHSLGLSDNLVLSGGCALNSSFNGQILQRTPFKKLHVFSAPADDGSAIGAAQLALYHDNPKSILRERFQSPYLGETISPEALQRTLQHINIGKIRHLPETICEVTARAIADGKIIGWVQGRAEFGPRALGNRSILADPRRADIKDRINDLVKMREAFRPYAPSILHEHGPRYFEDYQESPYMERTLRFRPDAIDKVPGVVHVNQTGRLHTVKKEWNEKFYHLLEAFYDNTSVPVLLNTSFNVMGKPMVHTVEDAVAVFMTSGMDALVVGDYIFEK